MSKKGPILGMVLVAIAAVFPWLLPNQYYIYVFNRGFANAIAVLGLVVLFGLGGQISLGHVAFFAIAAYTSAILAMKLALPPLLTIACGVVFASIWGALLSIPAFRLSGPFLAICTVAFGEVVRLLIVNWIDLTNGPYGLNNIPPVKIAGHAITKDIAWYYVLLGFTAIAAVVATRLKHSYIGRALMAIREDETAAEIMGVKVRRFKMVAFVSAAFFAGVAGALYAHFSGYLSPESLTGEQSSNFFSMAVVGGLDSIIGGIFSGVALTLLPELMRFLQEYYMMIYSLLVLIIVLFPPEAGHALAEWFRRHLRITGDHSLPGGSIASGRNDS
ncbi:MAG TPA: branched-chain amino acid ABC transporter permease [Firmicutes bacterium]|nr:branched-chain amino acid ABC transporter permease [Bacillota bacterium]